jgi:predicted DNA-binding protein (MmcQ/YjbR family)
MDIEFIRKYCSSLKGVTEDVKWGNDLVFSIGGKMFCVVGLEPPFGCSFKVSDEEFEELSTTPGFIPAPYMARAKWVKIDREGRLAQAEWKKYLLQSYNLVKAKLTKKQKQELGIS